MPNRRRSGPRPRTVDDLVLDLLRARAEKDEAQGRALFLIGAGCSASAGIPVASEVAKKAIIALARSYNVGDAADAGGAADASAALESLIEADKIPARYGVREGVTPWGALYGYVFTEHIKHPNEQRDLISQFVGAETPLNWAHACLGALVQHRFVHTILTTNFDQLALKGVIRTGIVPVVADGLESLNRISPTPRLPQVVHLHGSMHTYELRNSATALNETEGDLGLQVMMMNLLKEASVLVVVGYAGGEEGIMTLLQRAADALPRMVVYWIAYVGDFAMLTPGAKTFLRTGENKFFILNQDADEFFNMVVGELRIGAPDWIRNPLRVLKAQATIRYGENASADVAQQVRAYAERIEYAADNGIREDTLEDTATELRSAQKYREAAEKIEQARPDFRQGNRLLRIHAKSLYEHYNLRDDNDSSYLRRAIEELGQLLDRTDEDIIRDSQVLIEALREWRRFLRTNGDDFSAIPDQILKVATAAQAKIDLAFDRRGWAIMEFYRAEAAQLEAEKRDLNDNLIHAEDSLERRRLLEEACVRYRVSLSYLSSEDPTKAVECKEGLAGALSALTEGDDPDAASHLREARALFQEVVDSQRLNTPDACAGALENLATVVRTIGQLFPEERHNAALEQTRLLKEALQIYDEAYDSEGAARVRESLGAMGH